MNLESRNELIIIAIHCQRVKQIWEENGYCCEAWDSTFWCLITYSFNLLCPEEVQIRGTKEKLLLLEPQILCWILSVSMILFNWCDSSGKIPWRRRWQLTPVFLPGESHGQRILACYSHRVSKSQTQLRTENKYNSSEWASLVPT